jgi:hypothetical protein
VARLSQPQQPVESKRPDLEAELARLGEENRALTAAKVALERKRPSTAEDELRVLMLHAAAQDEGKVTKWAGERENAALRKGIAKTNASITRLRRKLAELENGKADTVDLRLAAFGDDLSTRTATAFVTSTMERLEAMVSARRLSEQRQ